MIRWQTIVGLVISFAPTGVAWADGALTANSTAGLKILFLGDDGHHRPYLRFRQLEPVLAKRGIALTYTDKVDSLNAKTLAGYDGLIVYANIDRIAPDQEKALLDFVSAGKGFIPLHCASYCFHNSPAYIALVGAQFKSHGTGVFRTELADVEHPILKNFQAFSSWDETYVHTKHNETNRTVLEYRSPDFPLFNPQSAIRNPKSSSTPNSPLPTPHSEPWTWVRTHNKGRVFYTAWGHDERTWSHPGFQNLVERGIRWACGRDVSNVPSYVDRPAMTPKRTDVAAIEYMPAKVPFYPAGKKWGVTTEPIPTMPKPLDVKESLKHFVTPVGFEVVPYVTEKKLGGKPIAMNWDERGRLFVCLTQDYPNDRQPPGKGRDRIVVCEDTNHDGVCDRVTTFADNLSIPTSVLPFAGGVIVHQAPVTLFLKDTKGDGKADVRQVLLDGWGTGDTHAGPSNLRYGHDNWIYGMVGYSAFNGVVAAEKVNFRQGFYRFKVEKDPKVEHKLVVKKLEFLRSTSNNSWGVGFSEEGYLFGSTANGCPSVFMPIPNRYYEMVHGMSPAVLPSIALDNHFEPITDKVRQVDYHGGFTAAAGHALYTARTYPPEYWNRTAFVCEPTGHLVATMVLQPAGSSFVARYGWNLLASDDEWSSPIAAEVGPDGNVWVIDWYNYIVQHNPTPAGFRTGKGNAYETSLRDKTHGRIYRVVYKNGKQDPPLDLSKATPKQLVETLKHPNMTWRLHAQRLLIDVGTDGVRKELAGLVNDLSVDATGINFGALHALGVESAHVILPYLAELDGLLKAASGHPSDAVQQAAFRAAPNLLSFVNAILASDERNEQLVIAKCLAMADAEKPLPVSQRRELVKLLGDRAFNSDLNVRSAITMVASKAGAGFLTELAFANRDNHSNLTPELLRLVAIVAGNIGANADSSEIEILISALPRAEPRLLTSIVAAMDSNWPAGKDIQIGRKSEEIVNNLLKSASLETRANLIGLASHWGTEGLDRLLIEMHDEMFAVLKDSSADDQMRLVFARKLYLSIRPMKGAANELLSLIDERSSSQFANGVLEVISRAGDPNVGETLLRRLSDMPTRHRSTVLALLLSKPESARDFLNAVEARKIRFDAISLDQKMALASHPDKSIASRARKLLALGGGLPDANRQKVIDSLASITKTTGNAGNGKALYVKHCAKCHKHGSEGTNIGPDLTGMAVHPKEELVIHILDPSRSVEGNYRAYVAVLTDGRVLTGLLAAETKTTVELVDGEAKRHALNRSDIESLRETQKSLMPDGFEKQMTSTELTDLLEFLTQKGKYVPIPLDKYATVTSARGMFNDEAAEAERLIFRDWTPKTFAGVPFYLVDPKAGAVKNAVMLHGDYGGIPPKMPTAVVLPCHTPAKAIHLLSGVGGWSYPATEKGSVSMIVRLRYADGKTEDHELQNGVHFADYIRRVDVPGSQFAFRLRGQQIRYLAIQPKRSESIREIELVKGPDATAPVVMAVTIETP